MVFSEPLVAGHLIRRYKRFLADIRLEDGSVVTAHCTNSGSMKSCIEEGAPVYLSRAKDPKRKTQFTWEMILINGGWVGVNTMIPNLLAYDAIKKGEIAGLDKYTNIKREVRFGDSRFDLFASNDHESAFIEVKNVTMKVGDDVRFPDAVSTRARKHLETLMEVKRSGMRAVMLYIIQRIDVNFFGPAYDIDPAYAESLKKAHQMGVEIRALQASVSPDGIELVKELPTEI